MKERERQGDSGKEGGGYVLGVKRNQEEKYEEIKRYFGENEFLKRIEEEEIYVNSVDREDGQEKYNG
ncbi:MAG: hypothetical protein LBD61_02135 [Endomicrobium sp.]|jgi:predicted transposase YbfD/YdcC|nr:hypothetical protein [Endomicrobium sp.]